MLVRAKRLGWDYPNNSASEHDDYDPPAWMDDGEDEWVDGEHVVETFSSDDTYREREVHTVGGQIVDPDTIERSGGGR